MRFGNVKNTKLFDSESLMTTDNPYRAPAASLEAQPAPQGIELAGRMERFGAAFIDGMISMALVLPVMYFSGYFDHPSSESFLATLGMQAASLALYFLVNGYFLKQSGQTLGKKMLGIKITDMHNNVPPLLRILTLRYLPWSAIAAVPVVGLFIPMIESLLIFRADRRCLHDLIAGTRVVKAGER